MAQDSRSLHCVDAQFLPQQTSHLHNQIISSFPSTVFKSTDMVVPHPSQLIQSPMLFCLSHASNITSLFAPPINQSHIFSNARNSAFAPSHSQAEWKNPLDTCDVQCALHPSDLCKTECLCCSTLPATVFPHGPLGMEGILLVLSQINYP